MNKRGQNQGFVLCDFFKKNKKGNVLTENIIFIVLNLVFLTIVILFLFSRMTDTGVLEEKYAKQIALAIDAAKPGMEITLNMKKAVTKSKIKDGKIVFIQDNIVTVKLDEDSKGYSYSFFNDVRLSINYYYMPDKDKPVLDDDKFVFKIEGYNE